MFFYIHISYIVKSSEAKPAFETNAKTETAMWENLPTGLPTKAKELNFKLMGILSCDQCYNSVSSEEFTGRGNEEKQPEWFLP